MNEDASQPLQYASSAANWAFNVFNFAEGTFWILLGCYFLFRQRSNRQRLDQILAILLIAFGVSDFVELWTRSWYQPYWMLAWKSINSAALFFFAIMRQRDVSTRRRIASQSLDPGLNQSDDD